MSPRSAAANQHIRDLRRDALLRAARRVFARKGLAATRVSDIAVEAGISQGLVYHYFPTKETLFSEIVGGALQAGASLAADTLRRPGSAWQRLEYLCGEMLDGVRNEPEYVLVILQAFTSESVPDQARAAIADYGQQTFADIVRLIALGQREGSVVGDDPLNLALAFTACVQGLALTRLQGSADTAVPPAATVLRLLRAG